VHAVKANSVTKMINATTKNPLNFFIAITRLL